MNSLKVVIAKHLLSLNPFVVLSLIFSEQILTLLSVKSDGIDIAVFSCCHNSLILLVVDSHLMVVNIVDSLLLCFYHKFKSVFDWRVSFE